MIIIKYINFSNYKAKSLNYKYNFVKREINVIVFCKTKPISLIYKIACIYWFIGGWLGKEKL